MPRTVISTIFLAAAAFGLAGAHAEPPQAGFERRIAPDGTEIGIWYPASGTPMHRRLGLFAHDIVAGAALPNESHPLVVMSHGTGGDFTGHADTAAALARAGFIVAALTHPGDNWRDRSRSGRIGERPQALSALISYMTTAWPAHASIDSERIGAFGFSAGAFTVLAAAGGRPDLSRMAAHCAAHPDYFDCGIAGSQPDGAKPVWPARGDRRIKAIVLAAPALGFVFDRAGLDPVRVPIQLWRADADRILPAPLYADAVRAALPAAPEFHAVPGAGHFDFLAPCADPPATPQLCASAPGFDREAFHTRFNAAVVRFFAARLGGNSSDRDRRGGDRP